MHCFWKASYLAVIVATCACQTETVVDPATVPSTENGAVAAGNRFFFVGGNALYELVQRRDGSSAAKIVVRRDDCSFTGLTASASTLYAACIAYEKPAPGEAASPYPPTAWSDLVRVELTRDQKRVSTTRAWGRNVLPNGMAVDARGDLYVSNSYSVIMSSPETPQPAVVRVRISGGKGFAIQQDTVVAGSEGGVFPNGLHIEGQRLWLVSNNVLFAADITDDGLANLAVV